MSDWPTHGETDWWDEDGTHHFRTFTGDRVKVHIDDVLVYDGPRQTGRP